MLLPLMFCIHMSCVLADRVEFNPATHHATWWLNNVPATYPYDFAVFDTYTMTFRIDYDSVFKNGME